MDNVIHFERQILHLHSLGPRSLGEFLLALAEETGSASIIRALLAEYESRLTWEMVCAAGGEHFPRAPLLLVPTGDFG